MKIRECWRTAQCTLTTTPACCHTPTHSWSSRWRAGGSRDWSSHNNHSRTIHPPRESRCQEFENSPAVLGTTAVASNSCDSVNDIHSSSSSNGRSRNVVVSRTRSTRNVSSPHRKTAIGGRTWGSLWLSAVVLLVVFPSGLTLEEITPPGMQKCVLGWCLPKGYQKLEPPKPEEAVVVGINIEILDILGVNDKEFSITLSMYFSVQWEESRLETNNTVEPDIWSPISLEFLQDLWVPNVFIYDLKSFKSIEVLKRLAGVWIIDGKDVFYNQFSSVTFLCPMRFERYPLDEHICRFRVGSTNMNINFMRFTPAQVTYDEKKRNTILDYMVNVNDLNNADRIYDYAGSNYSVTGFEMRLSRHVLKYLYIYYLPSGLFVVVSWVGFLIPPEVVPGRMAMLITLFLVLINIFNIVTTNSPNVEGMTAIAAWMLVCMFFVFGALVGYAYLLWKKKKSCLKRKRARKQTEEEGKLRAMRKEDYRSKVDDVFLVVFPIMFLVFNLIYWPMCLSTRHSGM